MGLPIGLSLSERHRVIQSHDQKIQETPTSPLATLTPDVSAETLHPAMENGQINDTLFNLTSRRWSGSFIHGPQCISGAPARNWAPVTSRRPRLTYGGTKLHERLVPVTGRSLDSISRATLLSQAGSGLSSSKKRANTRLVHYHRPQALGYRTLYWLLHRSCTHRHPGEHGALPNPVGTEPEALNYNPRRLMKVAGSSIIA